MHVVFYTPIALTTGIRYSARSVAFNLTEERDHYLRSAKVWVAGVSEVKELLLVSLAGTLPSLCLQKYSKY